MSNAIHRTQVKVGQKFTAPLEITAGYQEQRQSFSIWYRSDDPGPRISYAILATGSDGDAEIIRIRQTIIMPGGFCAFHLCEIMAPNDEKKVSMNTAAYHPDPELNELITMEATEAESRDLAAGYPPRWWRCPSCSASHNRGYFETIGSHRCLKCGYCGGGGIMAETREELYV